MIDSTLHGLLVCPEDHTPLAEAPAGLIERLNQLVASDQLHNRVGRRVARPLDGGLIRQDGRWLYPIFQGIPVLLVDEAVDPRQNDSHANEG
jgi:uncharacterized protein YbaR (Trm112 family)